MSTKKSIIYNISYQILIIIVPLITTPYISRVIGPEGIGIQSYTYSIANYFVLFSMLGVNNHGSRSIAMVRNDKDKLSKVFSSIFLLKVLVSIIMLLFYCIYIIFIVDKYKFFFVIQMIYIISALIDINWFFFGMDKFKVTVIRNTIIKIASVICIFIFVKNKNDLYLYSLILAFGNFLSQLILWRFIRKYIDFKKVSIKEILLQIKPMIMLFIPVIAISIYKIMDKIMLGIMSDMTQVGYFESSEKIINIPISIIVALGTVMLPKISSLEASGDESLIKKYISISMDSVMFMAIGACFGLIGVSKFAIPIFLGDDFKKCSSIVSMLAITIIFIAWANVIRTQFIIPKKKDRIYIVSTILGAIVNLLTNLLLIYKYGSLGAAIGTVFAEATVSIYQTIKVRKELNIISYMHKTKFYFIPGIIMYLFIAFLGERLEYSLFSIAIQIVLGGAIYLLISIPYMLINKNEFIYIFIDKFKKYKL